MKTSLFKFLSVAIMLIALSSSCNKPEVTGVLLTPETLTLAVGKTATLTATVLPEDATNKKVFWESSNDEVVSVDDKGNIEALAEGTATIVVTTEEGNFTASCKAIVEEEVDYPIEIPFTEYFIHYSRYETPSCQCTDFDHNNVIIVNSNEELERYINCDDTYPQIDFSEQSLLLARGNASSTICSIDLSLIKNASNEYALNMILGLGHATVMTPWIISVMTPKIDNETIILLNVLPTTCYP